MKLNRRDALVALGGLGLTSVSWLRQVDRDDVSLADDDVQALVALAETLYPSEVEVDSAFIRTYVTGQRALDEEYPAAVKAALEEVEKRARRRTGTGLTELTPERRGGVLRATGADRAFPNPEGTDAQRIRYYIINNLLYALYTTEKGGKLVGNPNPPGHPGGTTSYQRVSDDE